MPMSLVKKTADSQEIILGGNIDMQNQSTETLQAKLEPQVEIMNIKPLQN